MWHPMLRIALWVASTAAAAASAPAHALVLVGAASLSNAQSADSSGTLTSDLDTDEWSAQSAAGASFASVAADEGVGRTFTATLPADGGTRTATTSAEWYITLKNDSATAVSFAAGAFSAEWDFSLAKVESSTASERFTATSTGVLDISGTGASVSYRQFDEVGANLPFVLGSGLASGLGSFEIVEASETGFRARAESGPLVLLPDQEARVTVSFITSVVAGAGWAGALLHNANQSLSTLASRPSRRHGKTRPACCALRREPELPRPPMFERSCRELSHDAYREVLAFVLGRVRCRHAAADLTQESFARVLAAECAGTKVGDPRALLFSAARHLVIDAARHRAVESAWLADRAALLPAFAPSTEFQVALRRVVLAVAAALERLPARRRDVFLMFRVWGHSRAEIAAALHITEAAVAKHVVRATLDCAGALAELRTSLPAAECLPGARQAASLAEGSLAWQA